MNRKEICARKPHWCDYCGKVIRAGTKYVRSFQVGDFPYTWKSHLHCDRIASEIYDFVDPDDGLTGNDFCDAVKEVMSTWYCRFHCPAYDVDACECKRDKSCTDCLEKFARYLKARSFTGNYIDGFRMVPINEGTGMDFKDLTREQRLQLKQGLLTEELYEKEGTEPSIDELAHADKLISDEKLKERYVGTLFVPEDFL